MTQSKMNDALSSKVEAVRWCRVIGIDEFHAAHLIAPLKSIEGKPPRKSWTGRPAKLLRPIGCSAQRSRRRSEISSHSVLGHHSALHSRHPKLDTLLISGTRSPRDRRLPLHHSSASCE